VRQRFSARKTGKGLFEDRADFARRVFHEQPMWLRVVTPSTAAVSCAGHSASRTEHYAFSTGNRVDRRPTPLEISDRRPMRLAVTVTAALESKLGAW